WDIIHLTSDDKTYRLDLDGIRREVQGWFEAASLDRLMGRAEDETGRIARDWLMKAGKRWRPFLTACAYLALRDGADVPADGGAMGDTVRRGPRPALGVFKHSPPPYA